MGGPKAPLSPQFVPLFLSIMSCPNDVMKSCYKLSDGARRFTTMLRCDDVAKRKNHNNS